MLTATCTQADAARQPQHAATGLCKLGRDLFKLQCMINAAAFCCHAASTVGVARRRARATWNPRSTGYGLESSVRVCPPKTCSFS